MSARKRSIRILIADNHSLFREGLRSLLAELPEFNIVGEAVDGRQAVELVRSVKPNILLLGLEILNPQGMSVLRLLRPSRLKPHIILVADKIEEKQAAEAFKLGARGIIFKNAAVPLLLQCINAVAAGHYWVFDEAVSDISKFRKGTDYFNKNRAGAGSIKYGLTKREMEILAAVVSGKTNREIAAGLSISEQTVKHHVTNIFDKVGAYNRLELALFAIHHGLINKKNSS